MRNTLTVARDGEEALEILSRSGQHGGAARPDPIVLGLNLPRKDGREVLATLKADPLLKHIPVVVLTTSSAEVDILNSYQLHANCYITKPVDLEQFVSVIKSIDELWLTVVKLPAER